MFSLRARVAVRMHSTSFGYVPSGIDRSIPSNLSTRRSDKASDALKIATQVGVIQRGGRDPVREQDLINAFVSGQEALVRAL